MHMTLSAKHAIGHLIVQRNIAQYATCQMFANNVNKIINWMYGTMNAKIYNLFALLHNIGIIN